MKKATRIIASGVTAAVIFGAPLLTAPARAATGQPSGIAVSGDHLVDSSGHVVVLRGVNLSGTEFACAQGWDGVYGDQPLDEPSTYAAIAAWGANVVRVPLNEDCWLGINGVKAADAGSAYQQAIAVEVNLIHAAGMYAILDLHWSAPGAQTALSQNPAPDADHSSSFWSQVGRAYMSDPNVIFDVFNEPYDYWGSNPDRWEGWLRGDTYDQYVTGGSPYTVSRPWKSVGMQQLVDAIRASGAKQPIILNGLDWANDLSGWLTHAPRDPLHQIVAGWHSYPAQGCSRAACWESTIAPIASSYPIVVGEVGDSSAGPEQFLPVFLPWADGHGLSYLAWTWNPWQNADNVLVKDWSGTPTDGEGEFYKQHLLTAPVVVPVRSGVGASPPVDSIQPPDTTPDPVVIVLVFAAVVVLVGGAGLVLRARRG